MDAKAKIARHFKRHTGTRLNPLMATSTSCGAIVDIDRDGDVDFVGLLSSLDIEIPPIQTGTSSFAGYADVGKRSFTGDGKLSLAKVIPFGAALQDAVQTASEVSVAFSNVVTTEFVDIIALSRSIAARRVETGRGPDRRLLDRFLRPDAGGRIVGTVYRGTISIRAKFEGSNSSGFTAEVYDSASANVGFKWKRTSAMCLETDVPVPFAFDAWLWRNGRLRDSD